MKTNILNNQIYTSIVFVDTSVEEYQSLIKNIAQDTKVFLLSPNQDGVAQITERLSDYKNLKSIQILSHGSQSQLVLGNGVLNGENINAYQAQLQQWGQALSPTGDILLLGCNLAQGNQGQEFIQRLSEMTKADVAASEDLTGNAALGGDWELEYHSGLINAPLALQIAQLEAYQNTLALYTVTNTYDSGSGSLRQAIIDINYVTDGIIKLIDLRNISGTITLESSLPTLKKSAFIIGDGDITIDGDNKYQIISIDNWYINDGAVGIEGVNFKNGYAKGGDATGGGGGGLGAGGAIFINDGDVALRNVYFFGVALLRDDIQNGTT